MRQFLPPDDDRHPVTGIFVFALLMLMGSLIFSSTLSAKPYIPSLLEQWEPWVMYEHKDFSCPHSHEAQNKRYCLWPVALEINIQRDQATFQQTWRTYNEGWLTLPGDHQHWPTNVTIASKRGPGRPVAVLDQRSKPSLFVQPGEYTVSGQLSWLQRPESIAVPIDTGMITLIVDGKKMNTINRDDKGRLWFAKSKTKDKEKSQDNTVTTRVYRKVIDGVPIRLETRLEMDVAGANRELILGRMQLAGYETLRVESALPARIEEDGSLRVQVRAGRWNVTLLSRQLVETSEISSVKKSDDWPEQEIWVFQADRKFRTVKIVGVPTVDPEQTGLPQNWRQLPAYVLSGGQTMKINEQIRGDSSPDDNRLSLKRHVWLDFDGGAYTIKDEMNGNVSRIGRLSTVEEFSLGRVSVNGKPYVVTQMDEEGKGVEVRPGAMALEAVGRLARDGDVMSAVGWSETMQGLSMNLHLPPGWRLLAASGSDSVQNSWLSSWSLWHVFILLITAVSASRLFGVKWALLVGIALLSVHDVIGAPWSVAWLILLALFSLLNVVPTGRWRMLISIAYRLLLMSLVISLVPFSVNQIRQGIYPQLEKPHTEVARRMLTKTSEPQIQLKDMNLSEAEDRASASLERLSPISSISPMSSPSSIPLAGKRKIARSSLQSDYQRYDVNTKIQTGPGVPQWTWNLSRLGWSGPVTPNQTVDLWLVGPTANAFLSVARVLLMALLLVLFFKNRGKLDIIALNMGQQSLANKGAVVSFALVFATITTAFSALNSPQVYADVPTQKMLDTLEERLLKPKECLPHCAAINQGSIVVDQEYVTLDLLIDAAESVAVPLPIDQNTWEPDRISVNANDRAVTAQHNGVFILLLNKGRNRVVVRGAHHQVEQLNFSFKLSPHNIKVRAKGWEVIGYVNGMIKGRNLQLKREPPSGLEEKRQQLLSELAPAFVEVVRTLHLGIEWRLTTQVRRMSPTQGPISLAVPLLENESLTADLPVENGRVLVSMASNQNTVNWESNITIPAETQQKQVSLEAFAGSWVERWNVVPSQRWHLEFEGILPIKQADINQLSWWPIVGDKVALLISKPNAVEGSTLTLQAVDLLYQPGERATKSTLSLNMRSSFAGEYILKLPDDVNVEYVIVDGESQVRADDSGRVIIPIRPGEHKAEVRWLKDDGARYKIVTPALNLGQEASNVSIKVDMPSDRWILLVGGPAMGPALLFWGVALIIVAVGIVLGRMQWSLLKPYEWALLGLGVATTFVPLLILIVSWFYLMNWRKERVSTGAPLTPRKRMAMQWGLGLLTFGMLVSLLASIASSLIFGSPEMQIAGNGSNASWLNWYQDRTSGVIPSGWAISLPMWGYRLAMLVWSLWLAFALMRWLKWGWQCFSAQPHSVLEKTE